jgi:hypothetical protein
MEVKNMSVELNGKQIDYTSNTTFAVQVGKGSSSYQNKYTFTGDLHKAVFYFNCINIGMGYKKRLVMLSTEGRKVLVRSMS